MKSIHSEVKLPSNKSFGFFFTAVFLMSCTYFLLEKNHFISIISLILSSIFFVTTVFKSQLLYPLNRLWAALGHVLGRIISPIIMGLIYFGLFTPVSILGRLFGRDELRLKTSRSQSFWKNRSAKEQPSQSFKNQF